MDIHRLKAHLESRDEKAELFWLYDDHVVILSIRKIRILGSSKQEHHSIESNAGEGQRDFSYIVRSSCHEDYINELH